MLLDTHVVLWWVDADKRLSSRAAQAIARADEILVSPISCWEIATLLRLGRIRLDRDSYDWIADLFTVEQVDIAPLSPQAAIGAGMLPTEGFPGDPADRLLYAQARELAAPLVTKDNRLREFSRRHGDVKTIW